MKNLFAATGLVLAAALALPAAADTSVVYGSTSAVHTLAPYAGLIEAKGDVVLTPSALGTGQLVLDVIDGKAAAAAIAMPLPQAVAAAREAAWFEGRMILIPDSLRFQEVAGLSSDGVPVGFVMVDAAPAGLQKVLAELR